MSLDVRWWLFDNGLREVSPAPLRYKLWRLEAEIEAEVCRASGIELLPVPPAALTGSGFLRPDCYLDPMHANAAYGRLVLAQLMERL